MESMKELRDKISKLPSEALGLSTNYLEGLECMKSETLLCHYYPTCLQPWLTLGTTKHSDPSASTILLQDNTGGLQNLPSKSMGQCFSSPQSTTRLHWQPSTGVHTFLFHILINPHQFSRRC